MPVYEIRVQGRLDQRWSTWFDGLTISYEGEDITVLRGVQRMVQWNVLNTSHLPFHVGDGARKDITMATQTPSLVRQTFRITVDIETIVTAKPRETLGNGPEDERSHQALVQHLLAHPPVLSQLLRSSAVEALLPAKKLLEAEYGWGRISEQQLLQPLVAELESAAQAYFTEELEDGATVYFFDGYAATIKQVRMTEVGHEGT